MRFGWLLPDASDQALSEGWRRDGYRPRHGKPPLTVRGALTAATVVARVRTRYLGGTDEDGTQAVLLGDAPRGPRLNLPHSG